MTKHTLNFQSYTENHGVKTYNWINNLPIKAQQPSNLKLKITHHETVTPSKQPLPEYVIIPGAMNNFLRTLKHMKAITKHTLNFQNYTENHGVLLNN